MDVDSPRTLLLALALLVGIAIVVAASTSGAAFGLYNPAWDGTSELRSIADDAGADVTIARNASAYSEVGANGTVAVVLAPETAYGPGEAARVRSFVEAGGTLVVADDVGPHANPLLADVGAAARLDGRLLRDEQHYYRGPALPVADDVAEHDATAGVDALTLNYGTAVVAGDATPIVNTSGVAYLDANDNAALDEDEPIGPYPVVTVESVGEGRVVVVGDPSALINVMLERPGNRAFAENLLTGHDRVLLDHSQADALPPLAAALLVVRDSARLQVVLGLLLIGLVGLWARSPSVRRRPAWVDRVGRRFPDWVPVSSGGVGPGLDAEGLAAHLRRRHPDWEPERIERVVESMRRTPREGDESSERPRG